MESESNNEQILRPDGHEYRQEAISEKLDDVTTSTDNNTDIIQTGNIELIAPDENVRHIFDEEKGLDNSIVGSRESAQSTLEESLSKEVMDKESLDLDLGAVTLSLGEEQICDQGMDELTKTDCSQKVVDEGSAILSPGSNKYDIALDESDAGPTLISETDLKIESNTSAVKDIPESDKNLDDVGGFVMPVHKESHVPQGEDRVDCGGTEISEVDPGPEKKKPITHAIERDGDQLSHSPVEKSPAVMSSSKEPEDIEEPTTESVGAGNSDTTQKSDKSPSLGVKESIADEDDNYNVVQTLCPTETNNDTLDSGLDKEQIPTVTVMSPDAPMPPSPAADSPPVRPVQHRPETGAETEPPYIVTDSTSAEQSQYIAKDIVCEDQGTVLEDVDADGHDTDTSALLDKRDKDSTDFVREEHGTDADTELEDSREKVETLESESQSPEQSVAMDTSEDPQTEAVTDSLQVSSSSQSLDLETTQLKDIIKSDDLPSALTTPGANTAGSIQLDPVEEDVSKEEKMDVDDNKDVVLPELEEARVSEPGERDLCSLVEASTSCDEKDLLPREPDWPSTNSVHELGIESMETNTVRSVGSPDDEFVEHIQSNFRIPVGMSPETVCVPELSDNGSHTQDPASWPDEEKTKGPGDQVKSSASTGDTCDKIEVTNTQTDSTTITENLSDTSRTQVGDIADNVDTAESCDLFPLVESALQEDSQNALHGVNASFSNSENKYEPLQDSSSATSSSGTGKSAHTFTAADVEACRKELEEMEQALTSFGARRVSREQQHDEESQMLAQGEVSTSAKIISATSESMSLDGELSRHSTEASSSMDSLPVQRERHVSPLRISLKHAYGTINMPESESSSSSSGSSASTGTTLPLDVQDISTLKDADEQMDSPKPYGSNQQTAQDTKTEEVSAKDAEEPEFEWEEYLADTSTEAVPDSAFPHVEASLRSNFEKGMKFEVATSDGVYWIGTVVMPCGQLLRLRYDGLGPLGSDGSKDFWCDAFKSDIHPLGWCRQNGKTLEPPADVKEVLPEWESYVSDTLEKSITASAQLLGGGLGTAAVDQIKQGMVIEVQHDLDHTRVWIARVLENIGGRLLLRYEGTDWAGQDFWLFYLHHRLHTLGWGEEMGLEYGPPEAIVEEWGRDEGWKAILDQVRANKDLPAFPAEVLMDQEPVADHSFNVGWKLEAVHPINRSQICAATVVQVFSATYFLLQIDDLDPSPDEQPIQMCCHGGSRNILPINWCQKNGIKVTPPNGWQKEFDWTEYLREVEGSAAPEECFTLDCEEISLEKNMRLESVDPENPGQICVATVTQIIPPLVFIHLESSSLPTSAHIVDCQSQEIFPMGWCESNNYPLRPPNPAVYIRKPKIQKVPENIPDPEKSGSSSHMKNLMYEKGGSWCPKIYFNHRCFSGPYLSKGRIAELPKCVGPGPVTLVMKEVLSMLINVAYKSSRVLRELQMSGPADPNMHQQVLKAKYKGKSYRAMVQLCKTSDQVVDFCKNICEILECCPNLFSPTFVQGVCPEKCDQLSKTKYTVYCNKKKRVGRPPGGHTNLEFGAKKPGKRRRRKRLLKLKKSSTSTATAGPATSAVKGDDDRDFLVHEDSSNSTVASMDLAAAPDGNTRKRKYTRHTAPPHEMKTRGVKLPRYSTEKRTHGRRGGLSMNPGRPPKYSPIQQRRLQQQQLQQEGHRSAFSISPGRKTSSNEEALVLRTNPLWWTVSEVIAFIRTTDCFALARLFKEEEIDGQALLMLNLPTVQELMEVKLGPAIKLCHLIERLKLAFFQQYAC